jgi:hypothetical protein
MFLAELDGGYHLFSTDESGRRHTRSTGAQTKPEAVQFLGTFNAEREAGKRSVQHI